MAGHSKWANIKHRKGAQDNKRGKIFTKLIREITVSARITGDVNSNPRLRLAIAKALTHNMTRDTIDRAIKRGVGGDESDNMEEIRYEGYGPTGVAIIVDCLTDNRNRAVSEVRHAFTKAGGHLGTDGSVSYLFKQIGQIIFEPGTNETQILEWALDWGAEDVVVHEDNSIEVITTPASFTHITQNFIDQNYEPAHAEITWLPSVWLPADPEVADKISAMIEKLESLDDVQEVYHNAEI